MARPDGRSNDELRPITFERDFTEMADGSCLVSFGKTRVLCTASIDDDVPRWMRNSGKGWVTAEYSMLPGASPERIDREAAKGKQSGRTVEIQRLIGRSLRAACDMKAARRAPGRRRLRRPAGRRRHPHGQHLRRLPRPARRARAGRAARRSASDPLHSFCAAISVGIVERHARARPALRGGQHGRGRHERGDAPPDAGGEARFVEVQGTAEGMAFSRSELDALLALAEGGLVQIIGSAGGDHRHAAVAARRSLRLAR